MDKLKMHSVNKVDENVAKIGALFPNCLTERINENGELEHAIDFDMLKQELSAVVVEGNEERYQFTWPDKKKSILLANAPIAKTLRPCREESVDFDNTENLYIEGDNLDVLKLLQETYLGKIKMIYIDPPYNTGSDFVYEDDFAQSTGEYLANSGQFDEQGNRLVQNTESNGRYHTDWLNMLYPRLKLAKDLLSENGVIFISIDDCEVENLKKICDEIFGAHNYICPLIWQSKSGGAHDERFIVKEAEYILVYAKNKNIVELARRAFVDDKYNLFDEYESERGKYQLNKLDRRMTSNHYTESLNYPISMPDGSVLWPGGGSERSNLGWNWRWGKDKVKWGIENGFIEIKNTKGNWAVYSKQYEKVDNNNNPIERTIPYRNIYLSSGFSNTQASSEMINFFNFKIFEYAKPHKLIKEFIEICNLEKNDILLDFFSGSATTAHAVMQLNSEDSGNRKFIMVQLPEETDEKSEAYKAGYPNICEIGKERIRRAGAKIKEENPLTTANLDTGFRVLKLDSTNMKDVYYNPEEFEATLFDTLEDNIKEDRTPEDLLFQVMLDLGVLLSSKIEETEIAGKKVFNVADNFLIACFDENVNDETITAIAKQKPYYFVMRDSSMASDSVATNFDQIFATYSPDTVRKVL